MNNILVTILMACKNPHIGFLREALQSVFSQTSTLWNLLIIHDNEQDRQIISDTLRELPKEEDHRISLLKNESRFITGALNTGMRHAQTPFVCSLLCDDLIDMTTVEVLTRNIKEYPEVDFFHSSRVYIDSQGKPISSVYQARESFTLEEFKKRGPVKHLQCWRVALALSIGGMDESLGLHAADDYDFVWCMAEADCKFKALPQCLYYYRDHRSHYRLTTHVPLQTQINELKKIWRKHGMTEGEIVSEIKRRKDDYLMQALFFDDEDKAQKEKESFDIRQGWRREFK